MTSYLVVSLAAFMVSGLTLYSGFGLGTMLLPVFALFFPVHLAIAATAVVHTANDVFKLGVVGRHADWSLVVKFGIPAVIAALGGATALGYFADFGEIARYPVGSRVAVITPIKAAIATLMLLFALLELLPRLRELQFDRKYLVLGGLLAGFFGGFSGHHGALRSAFLVKVGTSIETFVGTSAVIALMVDIVRITTYAAMFILLEQAPQLDSQGRALVLLGIISAFLGVMVGRRFLAGITMKTVRLLTGILLVGIALALGSGIV